jgi:hypothetical protein
MVRHLHRHSGLTTRRLGGLGFATTGDVRILTPAARDLFLPLPGRWLVTNDSSDGGTGIAAVHLETSRICSAAWRQPGITPPGVADPDNDDCRLRPGDVLFLNIRIINETLACALTSAGCALPIPRTMRMTAALR